MRHRKGRLLFARHRQPIRRTCLYYKDMLVELVVCCIIVTNYIIDFDWSVANEYIISVGVDKTVRLWDTSSGKCIRSITEKTAATCIMFHPMNGNVFIAGFAGGLVLVYNLSTGKVSSTIKIGKPVTALCMSALGDYLFVSDTDCKVHIYAFDKRTRISSTKLSSKKLFISCISYTVHNHGKLMRPYLLVNMNDNFLHLYKYVFQFELY